MVLGNMFAHFQIPYPAINLIDFFQAVIRGESRAKRSRLATSWQPKLDIHSSWQVFLLSYNFRAEINIEIKYSKN